MRCILIAAALLASVSVSSAATRHGALTGTWRGVLTGSVNGATKRQPITITINASQTAGTWKVSASCHGRLTLESISGGSHHYRRHVASGSTCAGGDIDCLWPQGKSIYDNVTPRPNGWNRNGTLHRVTST